METSNHIILSNLTMVANKPEGFLKRTYLKKCFNFIF